MTVQPNQHCGAPRFWGRRFVIFSALLSAVLLNLLYYKQELIERWMYWRLRNEYIVISFSTTPHRINAIEPTLQTLIAQKAPIKAIYLNIPYVFKRENLEYIIPDWLQKYAAITILRTNDYGPATKILGALEQADLPANAIIITVDDDVLYPANLALHLAYQAKLHPDHAFGIIGANPDADAELGLHKIKTNSALVSILQGYAGVAYRRGFFNNEVFAINSAPKECFNSDDIYLSFYLAAQGIPRQVVQNKYIHACKIRWETEIGTNANSLHNLIPGPAEKHRKCITYLKGLNPHVIF